MSSFIQNLASMPQPHLLHELHAKLAQNQPPVTPADNQAAPAQNQPPVVPVDNQAPVAPVDNQAPVAPVDNQAQVTPAQQPQLEASVPAKPAVPQYKNLLQQHTQREGLPLPVYQNAFDGALHSPLFRSTVVVNGASYASSKVFPTRKAAEMDAARIALLSVVQQQQEDDCSIEQEELTCFCKAILKEYADKINAETPDYKTEKGDGLGFTSSLTFNGKQYVGKEGRNKKESQHLAARAVILSILDSDARGVISKIIKSKKKMLCPAKDKVNNPCNSNVVKPAGIQTISNVSTGASTGNGPVVANGNIVKTDTQEPCTGNSSSVSAEPVSLVEVSATPNLEQLIVGSTSSKKRKRKNKKVENRVGTDAQHISDDGLSTAPTSLGQFMQQLMDSNRTSNKANVIATCHLKSMPRTYIATSNNGTWIVDSGASDHMTSDFQVFNTFKPCADSDFHTVRTVDGSLSKVIGTGSVTLSNNLHLKSVLFVPTLSCNLFSISKRARDMNCIIKFYHNHCEFQVEGSEKVFGSAKMHDGLYILKDSHTSKQQKSTVGYRLLQCH